MRKALTFVLIGATLILGGAKLFANEDYLKKTVVKIFTVTKRPNYYQPWETGYQESSSGSGCVVEGNRILTNAHVVSDQVFIQVLKVGDTHKYTARVKFVSHDSELALLEVDDASFFEGLVPVKYGDIPNQRDKVAAYGFPLGGEELSVTEGVVSRVEVISYVHSQNNLLGIQIDAAINPGNSGGPVFRDGKLVGISFQSFAAGSAQNIGYIVPVPVIRHFFKDIEDGKVDGVPLLGIYWQKMENKALKEYYKLKPRDVGVLVTKVVYGSPAWNVLKENDVILSMAGVPVADNGTVPFRENERLNFSWLITQYQLGQTMDLSVLRDGKPVKLRVTFKDYDKLVEGPAYDKRPTYYIFAGILFMPLSYNFMNMWGWGDVSPEFKDLYYEGLPSPEQKQVIIIPQVLAHDINVGYHDLHGAVVTKINGRPISEMKDVIAAFETPVGNDHVIEIDNFSAFGTKIVISASKAREAGAEILKRYGIDSDRSADLE